MKLDAGPPPDPRKLRREARKRFLAVRKAETEYARHLCRVAKRIGDIIHGKAPDGVLAAEDHLKLIARLEWYSEELKPWAESVAARMIADVGQGDALAWIKHGRLIGRTLKREIDQIPTGAVMRKVIAEQVNLIARLPLDAAERLRELTIDGMMNSARALEIAPEIMASGEFSKSAALMVARNGVSTTAIALTKARAEHIGSEGYIWRTSKDRDVRPSHKKMRGQFVRWDSPPTLDGRTGHCGEFANCRCFPEPILPDEIRR
jgi:SPP1 gp7 family putative phage head morphogenesis protein